MRQRSTTTLTGHEQQLTRKDEIENPLQSEEGFFMNHLNETRGLEIADLHHSVAVERTKFGTSFTDRFKMSNGLFYNVITILPVHLKSDIPVHVKTPWLTTERGHNRRTAEAASSLGMPVRLFGPPRVEVDHCPKNFISSLVGGLSVARAVSMDADISAYAQISNHLDKLHGGAIAKGVSLGYGESRGAMEGIGAQALSRLYGRQVLWLEAVDPCIPEPLKISDVVTHPQSLSELRAAIKTITHIAKEARFSRYIDTIDFRPEYLIPAIATQKTLFSGRAGEYAENVHAQSAGHVTYFDSSVANGHRSFRQKLSHAPAISSELLKGGHLTLAAREIIYRSLARLAAVRDAIEKHGDNFISHELELIRDARPAREHKIKTSRRAV